jgi:outer membrane protein assembly factor BamE
MRILRLIFLLLPLAACSSSPNQQMREFASAITPYKIDVRQGNYITQDMVAQLKPGMSRDQVRFVLGTPLVADIFHADRWDYVYRFKPGRGEVQQRRLSVFFEGNSLVRVAGDVVESGPGEAQADAETAARARSRVIEIAPEPGKKAAEEKPAEEPKKADAAAPEAEKK